VQVFPLELTLAQQFIAIGLSIRPTTTAIHVLGCSYPNTYCTKAAGRITGSSRDLFLQACFVRQFTRAYVSQTESTL
jgi:hypothetical protein